MTTQKKTLIIDARMIEHAGIGTYLQNLIPLIMDHFNVSLLAASENLPKYDWSSRLRVLNTFSPIYSVSEQLELPRKIFRVDGFWSPHFNIPILPVRARKRIVTIHDVFHLVFYDQLPLVQKLYAKQMFRQIVRRADRIITVSNTSRDEICRYTTAHREDISVIYNGIDTGLFKIKTDKSSAKQIQKKYGLPDRFILFVGSVKPHKNLKRLLFAFQKLHRRFDDIGLVVVGKYEGLVTADKEIAELIRNDPALQNKVHFTSVVPMEELPFIYGLAYAFAFPSTYEGFGLPPLEAMACGCPTIVSNIPIMREICQDAAYYVDPLNADDIAGGLRRVLEDQALRQKLKSTGLRRVTHFSWKESAEKHISVIDKLLAN